MRKTVNDLATGLRVKDSLLVVDKETGEVKLHWESGYSRRLDSHIRQNLIDGVKQLQSQMLDYHGEQFGSDGIELSAHAISAPDHLPEQQFNISTYPLSSEGGFLCLKIIQNFLVFGGDICLFFYFILNV